MSMNIKICCGMQAEALHSSCTIVMFENKPNIMYNFFLLLHILIFAKTMLIIEPKTTSDVSLIMIYKITNFYITKEIEFL